VIGRGAADRGSGLCVGDIDIAINIGKLELVGSFWHGNRFIFSRFFED